MGGGCGRGRRPLPLQLGGMGERCKLSHWGLGRSPRSFASSALGSLRTILNFIPKQPLCLRVVQTTHAHVLQQLFGFDVRLTHNCSLSL